RRGAAVPLDHVGEAGASQRAERGPDLHRAGTARRLRRELRGVTRLARLEIGGSEGHRPAQRRRIAHEGKPAVVGDVQPLVRIRPCLSAGTVTTRLRPKPARPSALTRLTCTSSPTTTVMGGAPNNPSASTSHSARSRRAWRAAASAVKFAIVAPVTKPPPHPA